MTGVDGMDEVGWEGAPLANSLDGALICLMHQDDSLQECLYMCLGLQPAQQQCRGRRDIQVTCPSCVWVSVVHDHDLQESFQASKYLLNSSGALLY